MASVPTQQRDIYRHAFWVSYRPGEGESIRDFRNALKNRFGNRVSWWGSQGEKDEKPLFTFLLFINRRTRVTAVWNRKLWVKAEARGVVDDVRWPAKGTSTAQFIERWAEAVRGAVMKGAPAEGSFEGVMTALRQHTSGEAQRDRDRRDIQKPNRKRRRQGLERQETQPPALRTTGQSFLDGATGDGALVEWNPAVSADMGFNLGTELDYGVGCMPAVEFDLGLGLDFSTPFGASGSVESEFAFADFGMSMQAAVPQQSDAVSLGAIGEAFGFSGVESLDLSTGCVSEGLMEFNLGVECTFSLGVDCEWFRAVDTQ
ncbi:hypothetical protein LX36DRAFT_664986 [Colletotrichum falcatum]|nr:hypothetical protein LX36DRAFT_664986 [Colletotrichum falcatum]